MAKAKPRRNTAWIFLRAARALLIERSQSSRLAEEVLQKAFKARRMPYRGRREDGSPIEGDPTNDRIVAYIDFEENSGILGRPSIVVLGGRGKPPVPAERIFAIEVSRSVVEALWPASGEQSDASAPARRGAPPTYDIPAIEKVTEDILKNGVPDKQSWLEEKVREELRNRRIFQQPGPTRMAEIIGPIYERAKAASPPSLNR